MRPHRWLSFSLAASLLAGCMANQGLGTQAWSENNTYNLWRISKGMDQAVVLQIMHKPFRYETFEVDQDVYDVWFYITRPTVLGQSRMVPQNLTPLTFRNGVLIDIGYVYYNYLLKEEKARAKTAKNLPVKTEEEATPPEEDQNLEKALETPPDSSQKPAPKSPNQPASQPPANQKPQPARPAQPASPSSQPQTPAKPSPGKPSSSPPNQLPGRAPSNPSSGKTGAVSMAKSPKKPDAAPQAPSSDEEESEGPVWTEEDERMEEDESEQNFDFW